MDIKGLQKGRGWEYRVHRAVFLSGWYVRRGVNLRERVAGSPQTMAEVDVFAISFDAALEPYHLVGECKDRKGAAKEADRVVWLLGLEKLLKADHVLFAKPSISEATFTWARPYEPLLWDEAAVQAIEKRYGLEADTGYGGSFNIALFEHTLLAERKLGSNHANLRRAWDYLSAAFWYSGNASRAKRLPAYFKAVSEANGLSDLARDSFVAEGVIALLVAAATTAGQLGRFSPARAEVAVTESFASGVASSAALREIAARADDFYRDALVKATRTRQQGAKAVEVPRLAEHIAQPPAWLPDYLDLARQIGARPQYATDVLRFADLLLFEQLIAGSPIPAPLLESIPSPGDELLRLVQLCALFLRRIWGVEAQLLDRLLAMPKANGDVMRDTSDKPRQMNLTE
ncbi:MAG: hypothetical protein ACRDNH_14140 [Gaiellaceae bacterium]